MSIPQETENSRTQTLNERAQELLKNAETTEWVMLSAEEYQEKFELSNAAMRVVAAMGFWDRVKGYKKLVKQYLTQLQEIEDTFRKKEKELNKKMRKKMDVE